MMGSVFDLDAVGLGEATTSLDDMLDVVVPWIVDAVDRGPL